MEEFDKIAQRVCTWSKTYIIASSIYASRVSRNLLVLKFINVFKPLNQDQDLEDENKRLRYMLVRIHA